MRRITLYRIFKNGFLNYQRNFWLSLAATAVMVITLFMISCLFVLNSLANISLQSIQEKVDISVYFKLTASEQTIEQIQKQVEALPEIRSAIFVPSVLAREKFKELHKDEPLLLESVEQFSDTENPFPASIAIRVHNLVDYPKIISIFQNEKFQPYVSKITDKRNVVDRLNRINRGIGQLGIGLTLIFGFVTIIVMFNTIRLTIYNRREEIEIMRLVGASNWYIRGPFIIEGIFYGLAGALVTSGLLYPVIYILAPKINRFLEIDPNQYHVIGMNFFVLFGMQLLLGITLGIISSVIVIRKYLKV